jgi:hypothetical protein
MKLLHNFRIGIISSFLLLSNTGTLLAETTVPDHQHSHGHDENAVSGLSLDHGEKWETDAPLRQGMQSINEAVMNAVPAYHHETMTKSASEKLAKHINDQVNYLIANCKLEPGADATLHVLIGDLLTAANNVSNDPLSKQGMPRLVNTLQQYQDYFEHPELKSIH